MKNTCSICGKEYDYCFNCKNSNNWRRFTCTSDHYCIRQIIVDYREGIINAEKATELFAKEGITANSELNLLEAITRDIKAIIAKGTPKKISKPKAKSDKSINEITDKE